mmetsp:Transcript_33318/g.107791  ORF Transcript_33318/g.107791 Transcript_33318/m.107791 type:complete len:288 (-) Transcript_33318:216-1079(-)|eukprot:scaffold23281_cov120-Isochrysis_galbana.AAC.6
MLRVETEVALGDGEGGRQQLAERQVRVARRDGPLCQLPRQVRVAHRDDVTRPRADERSLERARRDAGAELVARLGQERLGHRGQLGRLVRQQRQPRRLRPPEVSDGAVQGLDLVRRADKHERVLGKVAEDGVHLGLVRVDGMGGEAVNNHHAHVAAHVQHQLVQRGRGGRVTLGHADRSEQPAEKLSRKLLTGADRARDEDRADVRRVANGRARQGVAADGGAQRLQRLQAHQCLEVVVDPRELLDLHTAADTAEFPVLGQLGPRSDLGRVRGRGSRALGLAARAGP